MPKQSSFERLYLRVPWVLCQGGSLYELGVFESPPETLIGNSLDDFFGNQFAQSWWVETRWKFNPDMVELVDREMENISIDQDLEYYKRIKSRLRD